MRLESSIEIRRSAEDVWRFLADPSNLTKWDRGVAAVEVSDATVTPGVGFEFATVGHPGSGPDRGRMMYRVTEADPVERDCRAELTSLTGNGRFFRTAQWRHQVENAPEGSRVTFTAEFRLRLRYFLLAPVLYFIGESAVRKDLVSLKNVLENS
ncbi:MAG TPA: SRPBCC family protein [Bryobacteraceae bacterium]|nr:SRPBCC family protein [Bryobacteraceae bacterium]